MTDLLTVAGQAHAFGTLYTAGRIDISAAVDFDIIEDVDDGSVTDITYIRPDAKGRAIFLDPTFAGDIRLGLSVDAVDLAQMAAGGDIGAGTSTGTNDMYFHVDVAGGYALFTWDDVNGNSAGNVYSGAYQLKIIDISAETGNSGDVRLEARYEEHDPSGDHVSNGRLILGDSTAEDREIVRFANDAGYDPAADNLADFTGNTGVAGFWQFEVVDGRYNDPFADDGGPVGDVAISGTVQQGAEIGADLTITDTVTDPDGIAPGPRSYQWYFDDGQGGAPVALANGTVLTQAHVDGEVFARLSYTDREGTSYDVDSAAETVANVQFAATGDVTITNTTPASNPLNEAPNPGEFEQHDILSASNTAADEDGIEGGTEEYTWFRAVSGGADVQLGTGGTYTLTQADVGSEVYVTYGFTDLDGNAEVLTSASTAAVVDVNDAPTGALTIDGSNDPTQHQTLSANDSAIADLDGYDPANATWQWFVGGVAVAGAVGESDSYLLQQADVGQSISLTLTYVDNSGYTNTVDSAVIDPVLDFDDAPQGAMTITGGIAQQRQRLFFEDTVTDIDTITDRAYQWYRDGAEIDGATGATYTLNRLDIGHDVTVSLLYEDGFRDANGDPRPDRAEVSSAGTGHVTAMGQGDGLTEVSRGFSGGQRVDLIKLNREDDDDQSAAHLAGLENGGFVAVWESAAQDGDGQGVYAGTFNARGVVRSGDVLVSETTAGDQTEPRVAALEDGSFVVVWVQGGSTICFRQFDASANPIGDETRVNAVDDATARSGPQITALAEGGFYVAWTSEGEDGDAAGVFGRAYDADMVPTPAVADLQLNATTALDQTVTGITELADGRIVVTWTGEAADGDSTGSVGRVIEADGTIGAEFVVNTTTTGAQDAPRVAALDDGGFVVTWMSDGEDGYGAGLFGQRYDDAGDAAGDAFWINTYVLGDQDNHSVTGLNNGGFVVLWQSVDQDATTSGIYGQRFDVAGDPFGPEFRVTDDFDDARDPEVTALVDGGFVVSWTAWDSVEDGAQTYAQRFDATGTSRARMADLALRPESTGTVDLEAGEEVEFSFAFAGRNAEASDADVNIYFVPVPNGPSGPLQDLIDPAYLVDTVDLDTVEASGDTWTEVTRTIAYADLLNVVDGIADMESGLLFAMIDPADAVLERNESNNTTPHLRVRLPDLDDDGTAGEGWNADGGDIPVFEEGVEYYGEMRIAHFELSTRTPFEDEDIFATVTVTNDGQVDAEFTQTDFYWSATEIFDWTTAQLIGTEIHNTVHPGQFDADETVRLRYEDVYQYGSGFIFAHVNGSDESDTDNNFAHPIALTFHAPGTMADLQITAFASADTSLADGEDLDIAMTVLNDGYFDAPSTYTQFYWSATNSFANAVAITGAHEDHSGLDIGESTGDTARIRYETLAALGTSGYIFGKIDPDGEIWEESNANNVSTSIFYEIEPGAGAGTPNLVINALTSDDTALSDGEDLFVNLDIENDGDADIGKSATTYYWSDSAVYGAGALHLLDMDNHGSLDAGERDAVEVERLRYEDIAALGDGWIFGVIAPLDGETESSTADNVSNALAVTLEAPATGDVDLAILDLTTGDANLSAGEDLILNADVQNVGGADNDGARTLYYWSADDSLDLGEAGTTLLGADGHGSLDAGERDDNEAMRIRYEDLVVHGDGYVFGVIEPTDGSVDADLGNNTSDAVAVTFDAAGAVDLQIAIDSPLNVSLQEGDDLDVVFTVSNTGSVDAYDVETTFYWSDTSDWNTGARIEVDLDGQGKVSAGEVDDNNRERIHYDDLFGTPGVGADGFIFAQVDADGGADATPGNNISDAIHVQLSGATGADLVINRITTDSDGTLDGEDFRVYLDVENRGGTDAGSVTSTIYWSQTDTFDLANLNISLFELEEDNHGLLRAAEEELEERTTIRYEQVAGYGDGYLFAMIDAGNLVGETDEANNVSNVYPDGVELFI